MQTPKALSVKSNTASASVGSWVQYASFRYYKSDSKASLAIDIDTEYSRNLSGLVIRLDIEECMVNILQLVAVDSGDIDPERHLYVTRIEANYGAESQAQGKSSPRALCLVLKDVTISIRQIICNFYEEWQSQVNFDTALTTFIIRQDRSNWSEERRNEEREEWEVRDRLQVVKC
ncbi:hypothetical protein BKA62DRAFT_775345 [Auriculariales sp. MPI-PUGE-AT-0066]|nr:hypothetical protein BKA62DRAFT_775345 [Auriculariales sp. MPI-PUGE-AT-0066]